MRSVTLERDIIMHPAGSCMVTFGNTRVICTATIENDVPSFLKESGKGWAGVLSCRPGCSRECGDCGRPRGV